MRSGGQSNCARHDFLRQYRVPGTSTELKGTGMCRCNARPAEALPVGVREAEERCLVAAEQVGARLGGYQVQTSARTSQNQPQPAWWRGRNFSVMEPARHLG